MPGRDGTGPMGMGPMTGRAMGNCAGAVRPAAQGYGRGFFCRCGSGRNSRWYGRGFGPYADAYETGDEKSRLKNQAELLRQQLDGITRRIGELDKED